MQYISTVICNTSIYFKCGFT